LPLPLDEPGFFANSFAVVVNNVCKVLFNSGIVVMGKGLSWLS